MSRSRWKLKFLDLSTNILWKNNNANFFIFNRQSVLITQMLGAKIFVYNGNKFFSFLVTPNKLGHKMGEFSPTRKKPILKKKKLKKKPQKNKKKMAQKRAL